MYWTPRYQDYSSLSRYFRLLTAVEQLFQLAILLNAFRLETMLQRLYSEVSGTAQWVRIRSKRYALL